MNSIPHGKNIINSWNIPACRSLAPADARPNPCRHLQPWSGARNGRLQFPEDRFLARLMAGNGRPAHSARKVAAGCSRAARSNRGPAARATTSNSTAVAVRKSGAARGIR